MLLSNDPDARAITLRYGEGEREKRERLLLKKELKQRRRKTEKQT